MNNYKKSSFSSPHSFRVSTCCILTDFNADNEVNITDWSVFLFRFSSPDKDLSSTVDFNRDGEVNISDFSVFLGSISEPNIFERLFNY